LPFRTTTTFATLDNVPVYNLNCSSRFIRNQGW